MRTEFNEPQHEILNDWLEENVGHLTCPICGWEGWGGRWKGYFRLQPFPEEEPFEPQDVQSRYCDLALPEDEICFEYEVAINCWECGYQMCFSSNSLIKDLLRAADDEMPIYRFS